MFAIAIRQAVHGWARFGDPPGAQGRSLLRVPTMSNALVGLQHRHHHFIAIIGTLSVLQVPIASVVTIGGIAAVAIGFAAQSLVRDFLNGLLVLFEDQYVEGDYVADRRLSTASSSISRCASCSARHARKPDHDSAQLGPQVVNSSRNWSRVDYRITVERERRLAQSDRRRARRRLKRSKTTSAGAMRSIDPIEWIGVESLSRRRHDVALS